MAPRIEMIVNFKLTGNDIIETNAMFRSTSMSLDHAWVACDLTLADKIRILSREQEWHRRKVKEAIDIKQQDPP